MAPDEAATPPAPPALTADEIKQIISAAVDAKFKESAAAAGDPAAMKEWIRQEMELAARGLTIKEREERNP
jgi:hypothetical protein